MSPRPRRLPRPHRDDILIAAAGLLGGLGFWAIGLHSQSGRLLPGVWVLLPLFVMSALELLRRTAPPLALSLATLTLVTDQFTRGNLATVLMFTDIMYAAVLYGTPAAARRIPRITVLLTIALPLGFYAWLRSPDTLLVGVGTGLIAFAPAATGLLVRHHREAADTALLQAEQTALLAEMDRTQAVLAERSRMARELHDMVANHLSAIAIHSTAALSIDDPKTSRDALAVIRENSVDGLAEMRRLIGLLRDSSGDQEPAAAPTLAGLDALIAHARTNGLDAHLTDERPTSWKLPTPVELAAYRIVQESLTNALKHAAPGEVTVALTREAAALTVCVRSPYGERPGPRAPGSGAGLIGMRERVALLGGEFAAGVRDDEKVWQVRAELPVPEGGSTL
ncbi:histidine kinase [Streptomyces sp. NPDC050738]|uniref:sensor histidine kinase n=1 Tax=Streptomyces sp. NPDC050738 TaxID=3154744 RepID=UPI00343FD794